MESNVLPINEDVRVLFRELAGLSFAQRERHYARNGVSAELRSELEALLSFDQVVTTSLTGLVGSAAEQFLVSRTGENGRCGPYRLQRLLGKGGMGAVYLAERADGEVEQQVAIKFIRAGADQNSFRERFLRERQILASLSHPGIARLLDAGHSDGQPYLVMEHVEGVRIDEYAAGRDEREIVTLMVQVAQAVSYAHRNLIIHRDLKPSNILVTESGQPKLLDFGIAKILDDADETLTLERILTPEYASPEQHRGEAQATATDIYSLGAVLHRILTGASPRAVEATPSALHPDLAAILRKAMREEPAGRYASVDLFIADLEAYLTHRPVEARRGNAWYVTRKFVRRRWVPIVAGVLAVAGLAGGLLLVNRERAIAEHRFQQVRQLSKQFFDLDAEIRTLPGATKARHRIVSASLEYLERVGSEARRAQDADLALEIGAAYLQVARVQGVPTGSNLGRFTEARQSLGRAEAFAQTALLSPDDRQRRTALRLSAEAAHDSMLLAESASQTAESLAFGRKVAARLDALLLMPGSRQEDEAAAARSYATMALSLSNLHRLDDAVRYARRSVELLRRPGSDQRQLGRALGVLANTARFSGDLDGALVAIRESRAIAERLLEPNSASQLTLGSALWREGLILGELNNINLDRPREAVPLLERAFTIAEDLAAKDSHDYTSRSYVSMAGRELGDLLRDSEPARALAVYDRALLRLAEVKNNAKARSDEVWLLTGSSYALRRLHRPREAEWRIQAALRLAPVPIELGGEGDAALRALADHYADTGRVAEAVRTYDELRQGTLAARPEHDLRHANALTRLYRELGALHQRTGQTAQADQLRRRRLDLWRHWDHRLPNNPFIQRQLAAL